MDLMLSEVVKLTNGNLVYGENTVLESFTRNTKELKKGDVITFSVDNKVVSHRIVKIDNNLIETKGDANKINDINKVNYKDVLGKVGKISIPFIGYFIKTVNSHLTIFIIVAKVLKQMIM